MDCALGGFETSALKRGPLRAFSQSTRDQWKWLEEPPKDWNPQVKVENDRVTVTFYTYSGLEKQAIYRHTDTYKAGKYRPKVEQKRIAEGPPGFML